MSYYDRSPRRPRPQPTHRLTVSQIKQLEASLQELEREVARWKERARQWEAAAKEEYLRVTQLEAQLQEGQDTAPQAAEEKVAQLQDRLARAQADYENSKKRLEGRVANQVDQKFMQFLRDLLPIMDNLDRAIQHAPANTDNEILDGVKLTRQLFLSTLDSYGVQPLEALEQPFDPVVHEAIGTVNDPAVPPGIVVEVEQAGYTYRGKLLRPARVLITPIG
ncbi:MAG: nucleotide exchange factor GrpE [Anaerolineales bacterium]|jgi:molecular chaperone GrpE|nr:nucleotide exchange factor GrpE [Anaerolineales bacterium]